MKRLFCILLLLCLLPVSGLAHQKGFGVYAMDAVNARQSPGGDILFKKQKGEELYILSWRDIVHIEAGFRSPQMAGIAVIEEGAPMMAGIRTDGRVIALDPALNQEVSGWADIVEIQTGDGFLLGLRQDGSVVVAGKRGHLFTQDIKAWEDIVDIACGESFCAGVTRDGRVLFAGEVAFSHN